MPAKLLYVTQSSTLVAGMAQLWQAQPCASTLGQDIRVVFKTYEDIHRDHTKKKTTLVDETQFTTWLASYRESFKQQIKSASNQQRPTNKKHVPHSEPEFFKKSELFYQEFRIIAAYTNKEDYLTLGQRQSLFNEEAAKTWLHTAFLAYLQHLSKNQQQDPALCPLEQQEQYDLIVTDEAQDLSHLQLKALFALAKAGRIAFLLIVIKV